MWVMYPDWSRMTASACKRASPLWIHRFQPVLGGFGLGFRVLGRFALRRDSSEVSFRFLQHVQRLSV